MLSHANAINERSGRRNGIVHVRFYQLTHLGLAVDAYLQFHCVRPKSSKWAKVTKHKLGLNS